MRATGPTVVLRIGPRIRGRRGDVARAGRGTFGFASWHRPHAPPPTYRRGRFTVDGMVFPSRPVDIPAGTLARWPVGLDVAGVRIDRATASVLTLLPGPQRAALDAVHAEIRSRSRSDGAPAGPPGHRRPVSGDLGDPADVQRSVGQRHGERVQRARVAVDPDR
ncbi:hypothetical protein JCM9534A_20890 [Catenuloplanes indicus JCM 9534]